MLLRVLFTARECLLSLKLNPCGVSQRSKEISNYYYIGRPLYLLAAAQRLVESDGPSL
jgi:hypothetical protein